MQKIMFNDRYGLTRAVIEGRKTMTRRIEGDAQFQDMAAFTGEIFYNEDTGWIDMQCEGIDIFNHKPRYKVGEIVAVAQSYKAVGIDETETIPYRKFLTIAREHKGWRNKMYVSAELMPHQIRITGIKCERLQDISDEDCIKEGVRGEGIGFFVPGIKCKDWSKESHVDTEDGMTWKLFPTRRQAFASLIDRVSGKGTWKSNPWVVVYEFELIK